MIRGLSASCWALCVLAGAQEPKLTSEFEVASLKQLDRQMEKGQQDLSFVGKSGKLFQITGNRITIQGTLRKLISAAYDVKDYQIAGTPEWGGTLVYALTAESPGDAVPTQEQVRPMLKALLAERFQLKLHRDTKELPVYHLAMVKKSNFLKPAGADETFHWDLTPGPGGTLRSKATRESIADFVQLVGVSADRPVVDKTGLTGDIDYDILITAPDGRTPEDVNRAILYAVIDQLGLKLESTKAPVDVFVIDHVEKPTAN